MKGNRMNRNKTMLIVISCIIAAGAAITFSINEYVKKDIPEAIYNTEEITAGISEAPEETQAETVMSPLAGSDRAIAGETVPGDLKSHYLKELKELDIQIEKMRREETDSTTYALMTAAETELKLWDAKLNEIYNAVIEQMDDDEKSILTDEETGWIKMRDSAASEAAKKYSGGTMEGLEYTATMASLTRDRAFELVEKYLDK